MAAVSLKASWSFLSLSLPLYMTEPCRGRLINVVRSDTFSPKNMMRLKRPWLLSVRHFMTPPTPPLFPTGRIFFSLAFFFFDLGKVPKLEGLGNQIYFTGM